MGRPRVSIGMPVYNGGAFIAETLGSLLSQTYRDFELIISDNASTDDTSDRCRAFAAADDRIRYYREEVNRGAAWNFNRVFHLSRGEYFKWAAADDHCAPSYLARCVDVLDGHSDVVWCHTQSAHIDPQGRRDAAVVSYSEPDRRAHSWFDWLRGTAATRESTWPDQRFRSVLLGQHGNLDVFGVARADAMRKTSLQLPVYGGDKVFVGHLSLLGRFHEIPEVLFFSRFHASGSGALATATAQQLWIDPSRRPGAVRLRLLQAHAGAVRRTPMGVLDRMLCHWTLARYLLQFHKWGSVILKTCRNAGTGGAYLTDARRLNLQRDETSSRATADSR